MDLWIKDVFCFCWKIATVLFHGVSPLRWAWEDVDGDGDIDMIFHFDFQELVEARMTISGDYTLTSNTQGGDPISGTGSVNIGPKGPP